ncbi:MAG: aminotransferase class IV [Phycisphaerales bacterium]|nr:aminotransferase class IV [Phycisphaerales bacterium]
MTVWLNGVVLSRDEANISAFDAGFQHGVGLFETMHARGTEVFRCDAHLDRIQHSARALRLTEQLRTRPLGDAVRQTLEAHVRDHDADAPLRVRLTITGGDLNLLMKKRRPTIDPTIMIQVQPATRYPAELMERGARVVVADARANPFDPTAGHKTLNYWPRLTALQAAAAAQADEAIWLTITNHLAGGSVSNVFLVKAGTLLTPIARGEEEQGAVPSPTLPGITRSVIRELADSMRVGCGAQMLTITDLLDADEVFLTNSSWGVMPVVAVEAKAIGDGYVGPITKELRTRYWQLVDEETTA